MSFFKKSFETITQHLAKMAEELMEHSERQRERANEKRVRSGILDAEARQHECEAAKAHETSQRLQTLLGG